MSARPLLIVALTVLGVSHVLTTVAVMVSLFWMFGSTIGETPSNFPSILAAYIISIAAGLAVLWKRRSLALWIVGPAETEQLRVTRRALLSGGLAVVGWVLVLDSLLPLSVMIPMVLQSSGVSRIDSISPYAAGPSIRMAFGAILLFLHPVLAACITPPDDE